MLSILPDLKTFDLSRPAYLSGSLAADAGFDPLRLAEVYKQGLELNLVLNPESGLPWSTATASCKPTTVFLGPNAQDASRSLVWCARASLAPHRACSLARNIHRTNTC